ncbi:hypothetical protein [Nonomuraea recticatena]|uniref:hypothetical protein n=1 Tax=Nonomuraea recticatena TaxID=46178 RepID=UPI0036106332
MEVGEYPGTGTYHRPPPFEHDPQRPQHDDRPTATLAPSDVLVARGRRRSRTSSSPRPTRTSASP